MDRDVAVRGVVRRLTAAERGQDRASHRPLLRSHLGRAVRAVVAVDLAPGHAGPDPATALARSDGAQSQPHRRGADHLELQAEPGKVGLAVGRAYDSGELALPGADQGLGRRQPTSGGQQHGGDVLAVDLHRAGAVPGPVDGTARSRRVRPDQGRVAAGAAATDGGLQDHALRPRRHADYGPVARVGRPLRVGVGSEPGPQRLVGAVREPRRRRPLEGHLHAQLHNGASGPPVRSPRRYGQPRPTLRQDLSATPPVPIVLRGRQHAVRDRGGPDGWLGGSYSSDCGDDVQFDAWGR